jgi:hypothetical protein
MQHALPVARAAKPLDLLPLMPAGGPFWEMLSGKVY